MLAVVATKISLGEGYVVAVHMSYLVTKYAWRVHTSRGGVALQPGSVALTTEEV